MGPVSLLFSTHSDVRDSETANRCLAAAAADACACAEQAARCRRLADGLNDPRTVALLTEMAAEYEARAREVPGD